MRRTIVLFAAACLALAGCGSSASDAESGASAAPTSVGTTGSAGVEGEGEPLERPVTDGPWTFTGVETLLPS